MCQQCEEMEIKLHPDIPDTWKSSLHRANYPQTRINTNCSRSTGHASRLAVLRWMLRCPRCPFDVQQKRFIKLLIFNNQQSTINNQELTITYLECVCLAITLIFHTLQFGTEWIFCSKPNRSFSLLPLDIHTTHAFVRCPRWLPRIHSAEYSAKEL